MKKKHSRKKRSAKVEEENKLVNKTEVDESKTDSNENESDSNENEVDSNENESGFNESNSETDVSNSEREENKQDDEENVNSVNEENVDYDDSDEDDDEPLTFKDKLFDVGFTVLSVIVTIILILAIIYVFNGLKKHLILDESSGAKTYEGYIAEKNDVFEKRYDTYFLDEGKLFPQYYVESAIYNQFVDEEQSKIGKFTKDYMDIDKSFDTFNIAPSKGNVENIECAYVNSDTLIEDLEARFGSSVKFNLDDSLLYTFTYKNLILCEDNTLELYLNDDGVSEASTDKYRIVFEDLDKTGLYAIPQLDYKSSVLLSKESTEIITGVGLDDKFGGIIVSLDFTCKPKYYEGMLFNVGSVKIYDKDSDALLVELTIKGVQSRLFSMINPFKPFEYSNLRKYGLQ